MQVRILLVDDHKLFRDGLRSLLSARRGMQIVGEAVDGSTALKEVRRLSPDVVFMDVSMPGTNGIEATRRIVAERPGTRVIVLSMHSDRRFVVESLKAGAVGYLLKDSPVEELARAVREVMAGRVYLGPQIARAAIQEYVQLAVSSPSSAFAVLTPREREVLQLIAEGRSTKEAAAFLSVSVKTIETHRKQIMDKLGLHSIAELTKYAVREGLTPLG